MILKALFINYQSISEKVSMFYWTSGLLGVAHVGLEIVGVSLDDKKDAWLGAIEKLGMSWHQLSDLQGWKNAAAQKYGVNGIPCTVLIGPDGLIVGSNLRDKELMRKLESLLK